MKEENIRPKQMYDEFKQLVKTEVAERFADVERINIACPACASNDPIYCFTNLGFNYNTCSNCKTIYLNPIPSGLEIDKYYVNSRAVKFFAEVLYERTKEIRRDKIFKPRAALIKELTSRFHLENPIILDIGGGTGLLADELQLLGINCRIIEPSSELSAVCRKKGFYTYNNLFESFDFSILEKRPLILTSFELLEHLNNPKSFFEHAFKGMKTGDIIFSTTLNGQGFDLQTLWEKSDSFLPPLHLVFFNPKSITKLLESIGFEIIEVSTPGLIDWDIVEGALRNQGFKLDRFWTQFASTANEATKNDFQNFLIRNNLSSHMRIIARKP